MIRENLSAHSINEQFALDSFKPRPALDASDMFGYGEIPHRRMDRQACLVTNEKLIDRWKYIELMKITNQVIVEFDATELSYLFLHEGVQCSDQIYEMYLAKDDLLCNYRLQVNLASDAPFFVKVLAFAKEKTMRTGKRHYH